MALLLQSKYPSRERSKAGSKDARWAKWWGSSHVPSSDTFILEDESKATRNIILTFLLTPCFIHLVAMSCLTWAFVGLMCVCLDTILPPFTHYDKCRLSLQHEDANIQSADRSWWVALPNPLKCTIILLANMVSALELFSLLVLQCLCLSKQIHDISLPHVASWSHANHSPSLATFAFP